MQSNIFDYLRSEYRIDKPIRLISLFSGYDSQAMALRNIGADYEHYKAVEFDKYAVASLNAVHGTDFKPTDICTVHGADLGVVDKDKYVYLMTYSFPCTDISYAGQMRGMAEDSGTRSSLLWEVKRILIELNELNALPDVLLMENVAAITNEQNKPHLRKWNDFLENIGYSSYGEILNACDYGIPQNRERFFEVSILGDYNYHFPQGMDLRYCMEDFFEELDEDKALLHVVKSKKAFELLAELDEAEKLELKEIEEV